MSQITEERVLSIVKRLLRENSKSLMDSLFDSVNMITSSTAVSGNVTSTTNFDVALRVIDSSKREFFTPNKPIRFRCSFYTSSYLKSDFYILVPAIYNQQTPAPTQITDFSGYAGIRVLSGVVYGVSKGVGGTYSKVLSSAPLITNDTFLLEMKYNVSNLEVFINNQFIGTIPVRIGEDLYSFEICYPVIAPIKSTDGTSVKLTMESYQVVQEK